MSENNIVHATLIEINGKGVLIKGKSQSGKSDLALRLISRYGAFLVADDIVIVAEKDGRLIGSAPDNLAGLLEIRGLGVFKYPYKVQTDIFLVLRLVEERTQIERMPKICKESILGLEIVQIDMYAKEDSAPDKVMAALSMFAQDVCVMEGND